MEWADSSIRCYSEPTEMLLCHLFLSPDKFGILCPSHPTPTESELILQVQQQNQKLHVLAPTEGTCYLGIYVACNGMTKTMEDIWWKKAILYTKAFQQTHMIQHEASILYCSCFLLALTYSLPATWLPATFLEQILCLLTSTVLNKMGYHWNLPCSVVFTPFTLGGLGLSHLVYKQNAQQTIILLQHLWACTPLGNAMEVMIHTLAILPLHNHSPHSSLWSYSYGIFLDLPWFKLEQLNVCHMFLQVTMLAKITDHMGTVLLP